MIGLDTNLLVRFFISDNPIQFSKVEALLQSLTENQPGWVGLAVILELSWVLNKIYRIDKVGIEQILEDLLSRKEIVIEQAEVVRHALQIYRGATVGFADCLISSSAHAAGCVRTLTFDIDAAKTAGMTLIT
jgi:predicted nucleic-acid-binding protein